MPSQGNYYEAGVSKALGSNLRLDANYYLREVANYADDDQIDNTTISFPIAFRKAIIYGAEGKIKLATGTSSPDLPAIRTWWAMRGFRCPADLFIGDDAQAALLL